MSSSPRFNLSSYRDLLIPAFRGLESRVPGISADIQCNFTYDCLCCKVYHLQTNALAVWYIERIQLMDNSYKLLFSSIIDQMVNKVKEGSDGDIWDVLSSNELSWIKRNKLEAYQGSGKNR